MNRFVLSWLFIFTTSAHAAPMPEESVRKFLLYQYGKAVPEITDICVPSADLWMLRGSSNPEMQQLVQNLNIKIKANGLFMDTMDRDICIVELKDGQVDPQFNLAMVYQRHRGLILRLLYHALLQDKEELSELVTKVENISFGGAPKAARGDMDVYGGILGLLPVVRVSSPEADAKSSSVTYKIPIGDQVFTVRIIKEGGTWKIDTNQKMTIPLRYFWR